MKRSELFLSAVLVPIDAIMLAGAFLAAYGIREEFGLLSPGTSFNTLAEKLKYNPEAVFGLSMETYLHYLSYIIPAMIAIFALLGLYAIRSSTPWSKRFAQIIMGVSAGEAFVLLLFLLKRDFFLPRSTVLYSWLLGIVFVICGRLMVRGIQKWLNRYDIGVIRVGLIGKGPALKKVREVLQHHPSSSYRIVMHTEDTDLEGALDELEGQNLDELIVINQSFSTSDLIVLRNVCLEKGVSFSFMPAILTQMQSAFVARRVLGLPMIEISPTPLEGWGRVIKRLFDLVVATLLILLFSPLYLLISLLMLATSPGPLMYKHARIGKNGKPITIWKFRTMQWKYCIGVNGEGEKLFKRLLEQNPALAAEWQENHKLKDDPRLSPLGSLLRRTSLDEIPQFFNVLGGSLSLVGPRPIVQDEVEKYGEDARLLFSVKPGITGLWQVNGRTNTTYKERIELDTFYIEHWNVGRDILILLRTVWVLLIQRKGGAY